MRRAMREIRGVAATTSDVVLLTRIGVPIKTIFHSIWNETTPISMLATRRGCYAIVIFTIGQDLALFIASAEV